MTHPSDPDMYSKVKKRIYKKYPTHSAYRSGILVKAYKDAFRAVHGTRRSPYIGKKPSVTGLVRWFKENWRGDDGKVGYSSKTSVYRPTRRVTAKTPLTFSELSSKSIAAAKREKARTGRVKKFKTI